MRIVQIDNDKAHWIFEADEFPEFAPNIVLMDISDSKYDEVQEGWDYSEETGEFTEPVYVEPEPPPEVEPTNEELILQNTEMIKDNVTFIQEDNLLNMDLNTMQQDSIDQLQQDVLLLMDLLLSQRSDV